MEKICKRNPQHMHTLMYISKRDGNIVLKQCLLHNINNKIKHIKLFGLLLIPPLLPCSFYPKLHHFFFHTKKKY